MSLPEKDLQQAINREVTKKDSAKAFARRLMRNFRALDSAITTARPNELDVVRDFGADRTGTRDSTAAIQAASDAASARAAEIGEQCRLIFPSGTYLFDNLDVSGNVWYDFGSATLKARIDQASARAFIRAPETLTGGTYYGTYDNITMTGGFIDPNAKQCHGQIVRLLWTRNLYVNGLKFLDFAPPRTGSGLSGTMAIAVGGTGGYVNVTTRRDSYGTSIHNDGVHLVHGSHWRLGGDIECGDDAFALGYFQTASVLAEPEPISDVVIEPSRVDSASGDAVSIYIESALTDSDYDISRVTANVTGIAGTLRNGPARVIDQTNSAAGTKIRDIEINLNVTTSDSSHDGVNNFGVWFQSAKDVQVSGIIRLASSTDAASMYQVYSRDSEDIDLTNLYFVESDGWAGIDRDVDSYRIDYGPGAPMSHRMPKLVLFDDFTSLPATAGDLPYGWGGYKGSDAAAALPTVPGAQLTAGSAVVNGQARMVTGAGAGASLAANGTRLEHGRAFRVSTGRLMFETRIQMPSAVTNLHLAVVLTGNVGSLVTPATLGASDTLTAVATNAVGFLYDTAADTDNWWGIGINASTGTKDDLGTAPANGFVYILRTEVNESGDAKFFIDGKQLGSLDAAIDPTVGQIAPVIVAFSRTNASKTLDVDYIHVEGDRI